MGTVKVVVCPLPVTSVTTYGAHFPKGIKHLLFTVFLVSTMACGENSSSPTAPSASVTPDTISLDTIAPPVSTTLSPGQVVRFAATVSYALGSADSGEIRMVVQDQTGRSIASQPRATINRGRGTVTLSNQVTIPAQGVTRVDVFLPLIPAVQTSTNIVVNASYPVT